MLVCGYFFFFNIDTVCSVKFGKQDNVVGEKAKDGKVFTFPSGLFSTLLDFFNQEQALRYSIMVFISTGLTLTANVRHILSF